MNWDNKAFVLTAVFYTLLLFMFLFMGFRTPLPLPAEQGILINFGDDDFGSGTIEPREIEEVVEQTASTPTAETVTEELEEQLTQDYEEAPAVTPVKREQPKQVTEVKPQKKPEEEVKKEEPVPVVNPNAMYQGRKTDSESTASEGETGGSGNQGSLTGDPDVTNRSLGAGTGEGIEFSLVGRSSVRLPIPEFDTQKEGKVVVRVRVDRTGKVIFAEPGVKGSTTLDSDLLAAAKQAALASRFNKKDDAPMVQEGTISYVFRLRGK
jgi:outer membrane biosynthesis protein TonB